MCVNVNMWSHDVKWVNDGSAKLFELSDNFKDAVQVQVNSPHTIWQNLNMQKSEGELQSQSLEHQSSSLSTWVTHTLQDRWKTTTTALHYKILELCETLNWQRCEFMTQIEDQDIEFVSDFPVSHWSHTVSHCPRTIRPDSWIEI